MARKKTREMTECRITICDLTKKIARRSTSGAWNLISISLSSSPKKLRYGKKKNREMTESRTPICDLTKKIAGKSTSGAKIDFRCAQFR